MKLPDPFALAELRKAEVTDPIIAGDAGDTSHTGNADIASTAGNAGKARNGGAKFTIRIDHDLLGRVRAAYLRDLANGFSGSLSAWAAASLEKTVRDYEAAYNDGQPYQPIESGSIPTGVLPNN